MSPRRHTNPAVRLIAKGMGKAGKNGGKDLILFSFNKLPAKRLV